MTMPALGSFLHPLQPLATADTEAGVKVGAGDERGRTISGLAMSGQMAVNWCWAAVTQAVLKKRRGISLSQEAIALRHLALTGNPSCVGPHNQHISGGICSDGSCTGRCNDLHNLRIILTEQGCFRETLSTESAPEFRHIRDEIDDDRPVLCRIARNGPSHVVLVSGWSKGADEVERVTVLDPADAAAGSPVPSKVMRFSTFVAAYPFPQLTGWVNFSYGVN